MEVFALFIGIVLFVTMIAFSVQKAKDRPTAKPGAKKADAAPPAQGKAPAENAAKGTAPAGLSPRPAPLRQTIAPRFESLEDRAEETVWHETAMSGEGTDPCHKDMFDFTPAPHAEAGEERPQGSREWARAVVMAEVLKRPSERRRSVHGRP